jgi:putative phosphoribosyl transferase
LRSPPLPQRFTDRAAAGRELASLVSESPSSAPTIVLGVPRGGIVVAAPIAQSLGAPLAPVWVKKLVSPREPDVVIGAVDLDGDVTIGLEVVRAEGLSEDDVVELSWQARGRLAGEASRTPSVDARPLLAGRVAILVDDLLSTGLTMRAAIRWVRRQHAREVVAVVPVVDGDAWRRVGDEADRVITLDEREGVVIARSDVYRDYARPSDTIIARLLTPPTPPR